MEHASLINNIKYIQGTFISLRVNSNKLGNIYDYTKIRKFDKTVKGDV